MYTMTRFALAILVAGTMLAPTGALADTVVLFAGMSTPEDVARTISATNDLAVVRGAIRNLSPDELAEVIRAGDSDVASKIVVHLEPFDLGLLMIRGYPGDAEKVLSILSPREVARLINEAGALELFPQLRPLVPLAPNAEWWRAPNLTGLIHAVWPRSDMERVIQAGNANIHPSFAVGVANNLVGSGAWVIGQNGANVIGQNGANVIANNRSAVQAIVNFDVIGQNGANVIGQNGASFNALRASLIGPDGASVIGQNGANVIGQNGANLISELGSGVIGQNGANIYSQNSAANLLALDLGNLVAGHGGNVIGQNGANVIGQNGASLLPVGASNVIGQNGANVIGQNGANVIGQNGANVIGQNGANVIGQNGAGVIGQNGANVIGQNGANVIGQNGANFR